MASLADFEVSFASLPLGVGLMAYAMPGGKRLRLFVAAPVTIPGAQGGGGDDGGTAASVLQRYDELVTVNGAKFTLLSTSLKCQTGDLSAALVAEVKRRLPPSPPFVLGFQRTTAPAGAAAEGSGLAGSATSGLGGADVGSSLVGVGAIGRGKGSMGQGRGAAAALLETRLVPPRLLAPVGDGSGGSGRRPDLPPWVRTGAPGWLPWQFGKRTVD